MAKLAQGHAAYELSAYVKRAPDHVQWKLLELMTEDEKAEFNAVEIIETFGEVGSRVLQRVLVTQLPVVGENGKPSVLNLLINDWVEVQEGWYRYHTIDDAGKITVRIVIREYLAGEVMWEALH